MTDRDLQHAAVSLERLREHRVRPELDRSIGAVIEPMRKDLGTRFRQTGGIVDAWRAAVPDQLLARTTVRSFRRGVLTIETPDTSTRFLVHQWLRGDGLRMVSSCAPATINNVVVKVVPRTD
ncbi:MAG: DciA family protein [Planctomycetota bacterium]|nr:DciA family protein [Planctomycetota bacterium]